MYLFTFSELPRHEAYEIELYMLVEDEVTTEKMNELTDILEKIVNVLEKNPGVKVLDSYKVARLSEITASKYISLYQLDFDYLSFRD